MSIDIELMDKLKDIWFYGDPHGDFSILNKLIEEKKPKAVFLLGDIAFESEKIKTPIENKHNVKLFAIHGNHDYKHRDTKLESMGIEWIDYQLIDFDGLRVLHVDEWRQSELDKIGHITADIIISHYPIGVADGGYSMAASSKHCAKFIKATGSIAVIHGHYHHCLTTMADLYGFRAGNERPIAVINACDNPKTLLLDKLVNRHQHMDDNMTDMLTVDYCTLVGLEFLPMAYARDLLDNRLYYNSSRDFDITSDIAKVIKRNFIESTFTSLIDLERHSRFDTELRLISCWLAKQKKTVLCVTHIDEVVNLASLELGIEASITKLVFACRIAEIKFKLNKYDYKLAISICKRVKT